MMGAVQDVFADSPTALAWPKPETVHLLQAEGKIFAVAKFVNGRPKNIETKFPGRLVVSLEYFLDEESVSGIEMGQLVSFPNYAPPESGGRYLLTASPGADGPIWEKFEAISVARTDYLTRQPAATAPKPQQLTYALKFLEHDDPAIAEDAYGQLARASYSQLASLQDDLNPDHLREWIRHADSPAQRSRTGLYGYLLGLCGSEADAKFLRYVILRQGDRYGYGVEGLTVGYLNVSGAEGLDMIELHMSRNEENVCFFSILPALDYFREEAPERIPVERLQSSLHLALSRPDTAEIAIPMLTRWEDWSAVEQVGELYFDEAFQEQQLQLSILTYLVSASKQPWSILGWSDSSQKAKLYLQKIGISDPGLIDRIGQAVTE